MTKLLTGVVQLLSLVAAEQNDAMHWQSLTCEATQGFVLILSRHVNTSCVFTPTLANVAAHLVSCHRQLL